jgi:aryl-alcohol dehydrogenase-like predicted oxidoreductase
MRYRPFARTGVAVSSISVALDGTEEEFSAGDWRDLVHAAFEEGVNTFEIIRPTAALMTGFAEGAAAVKRPLIFVILRIGADADPRETPDWIYDVLNQVGLDRFNMLSLELGDLAPGEVASPALLSAMRRAKDMGQSDRLAVVGAGEALDEPVRSGLFEALITPFNLLSGWRERNLIRSALERQMGVIGCEHRPPALGGLIDDAMEAAKAPSLFKRSRALAGVGTYAFLKRTTGWSIDQLCLGYALTEPAVASVQVRPVDREHLAALAEAGDRDLPASVSAQIEMARFSVERAGGGERRSERRSA